jgi:putative tryptophan/tyrosine transport system substrate-binding protein
MKRREFIGLIGGAAASWPLVVRAQQPAAKTYRIGIVWASTPQVSAARFDALRRALRERGYVEGGNTVFIQRGPERTLQWQELTGLVNDVVKEKVDVLLTAGTSPTQAAKSVAGATPIVMTFVSDPIGSGFVRSLAHPGGNITGLTNFGPEMSVKWLELIKDLLPAAQRIAVLYDPAVRRMVDGMEHAAAATGTQLTSFNLKDDGGLENAFSSFQKSRADALVVTLPPRAGVQDRILRFAATNKLPTIYWWREYIEAGGLVYYGPSLTDMYQRAAVYIDKILGGAKPADLPVEQPTRFNLVFNLKAAKALGLTVPPTLIARADEVIE